MYYRIRDFDFRGKRVLIRVDFNVPQDKSGNVTDDSRIRKAIPTIQSLKGAKQIILCSHLGRPEGKADMKYSLKPACRRFSEMLNDDIVMCEETDIRKIAQLPPNRIVVLENLRFDPGEESGDMEFAKKLASFADVFVFDAFGASHRAHASVSGVPELLPSCAGLIMEKEIENLGGAVDNPERPFVAIIGGAKADKIGVIKNLLKKVDRLILGGVLANTFLKAKGIGIGASKFDEETLSCANEILSLGNGKILLPVDAVLGDKFDADANTAVCPVDRMPANMMIMDIGPGTVELYRKELMTAKTIIWAGPIGVFEFEKFSAGTRQVAECLASSTGKTIIGGGDSGAAIEKFGLAGKMTWISTGGGASLEYLSGSVLPGVAALEESYTRMLVRQAKQ